jgi:TolA-binding protein
MNKIRFYAVGALLVLLLASCSSGPSKHSYGPYSEADVFYRQGNYAKAIGKYQEYLTSNPQGNLAATAAYSVGKCYLATGDTAKARESFAEVTRKYPGTSWAAFAQDHLGISKGISEESQ